ncbi:hypothetical protein EJ06DRAFT_528793 [Trichodelitschia bisporula]|uniref:RING-type domain-containing protein n=1 Tax=Trichodelitschia bisporula TaxID=703511 RepID=A0A6G1HZY5_9PEZI|nr:hypothetical protein EJ06DRAFT_528793 [Trichodelitschia bisporula]
MRIPNTANVNSNSRCRGPDTRDCTHMVCHRCYAGWRRPVAEAKEQDSTTPRRGPYPQCVAVTCFIFAV